MYLKSIEVTNFRKFGTENNKIEFVASNTNNSDDIQSIASATTLVVGKNNSGKTTLTKALDKIINNRFRASDFNYRYLNDLFSQYEGNIFDSFPMLIFKIVVSIHTDERDSLTNIGYFMNISQIQDTDTMVDINITIKYVLKEYEIFKEKILTLLDKYRPCDYNFNFSKFLELIEHSDFKTEFYNSNNEIVDGSKFKISDLIAIKIISADKNLKDPILSKTFNDIIKNRYKLPSNSTAFDSLDNMIIEINNHITKNIRDSHSAPINDVLHQIESNEHLGVQLSSDLTFERLMQNLIKYEYAEQGHAIPEGQFGLGYANLMNIIGEIINYVDDYPDEEKHSRINLICIEEPENYMHPQMQELFINRIDQAIKLLLDNSGKKINSQLIITTHSAHILNSKIHASNSFNNINYITINNNYSFVVNLNDRVVMNDNPILEELEKTKKEEIIKQRLDDLKFLKKHIKFKVSDLFFADAAIIVEGITEEILLPYYLEQFSDLKNYYVSIFHINGAHGKVYYPLIKLLRIPILLITDIDIKRTDEEKKDYIQVLNLEDRTTTNDTIKTFNNNDNSLSSITSYFTKDNLHCIFQRTPIEGQQSTSFEEALILTNYNNSILTRVLEKIKPGIFSSIVDTDCSRKLTNLINSSYKLQRNLSKSKSDFANTLLYEIITANEGEGIPSLPQYIEDGLEWLKQSLVTETVVSTSENGEVEQ